ncbi:MAG TPA: G1 family glutamic endopeptidase [Mycobacteriales bacterium]|nr:G1 family glutamic endopeptidase [Mycobacteriales bacterium]
MKRSALATVVATAVLATTAGSAAAATHARHSSIFAGYEVSKPKAHLKEVTATFVVPKITCEDQFGGVGPSVLVYSNVNPHTGTHRTSGGGIGVACENGQPFYQSVFIVNDKTRDGGLIGFDPGDVVVVTVSVDRGGSDVTIEDVTTNKSTTHTGAGKVASQTFIGDNSVNVDGVSGPLDPFTKTHVSNVLIDNQPLGSSHPHRYTWVRNGRTLVSASALTAAENFTLTFRSSG